MHNARNAVSEFLPGAVVHTAGGATYRICSELHRSPFWRDRWDVTYLAEALDRETRRVVLWVIDSFDRSFGGTFVATMGIEADDSECSFEYRNELDPRALRAPGVLFHDRTSALNSAMKARTSARD